MSKNLESHWFSLVATVSFSCEIIESGGLVVSQLSVVRYSFLGFRLRPLNGPYASGPAGLGQPLQPPGLEGGGRSVVRPAAQRAVTEALERKRPSGGGPWAVARAYSSSTASRWG